MSSEKKDARPCIYILISSISIIN